MTLAKGRAEEVSRVTKNMHIIALGGTSMRAHAAVHAQDKYSVADQVRSSGHVMISNGYDHRSLWRASVQKMNRVGLQWHCRRGCIRIQQSYEWTARQDY